MEQWSDNGGKYGKFSYHLYGNGDEQWLYEHGAIYGDDNDNDGVDNRGDDDVRRRQHNLDGKWRRHVRVEQWSYDGGKYGKFSDHLYGNGNEQWLYEHCSIYGDDNDDDGVDSRSDDDVRRRQHNIDCLRRRHVRVEQWSYDGGKYGKFSDHLYGDGNEQWLYEHCSIYGDDNDDDGVDSRSDDDVRRRQHDFDGKWRRHLCVEQWPYDGGKYGKFSDHLYGNGDEQWLYEHCSIYGDDNDDNGVDSRSDDDVRRRQHNIDCLRRRHVRVEQWPYDGGKYGKFSDYLYGNGNEQWLYEHSAIYGDDNDDNGVDSRSDDDVRRRQYDFDGKWRRHVRVEQWPYDGGKYGKFSEHLYGNGNEQWLYEHCSIYGDDNDDDGVDSRGDDDVRRRQHDLDGKWRRHLRVEQWPDDGGKYGKFSDHLYGNGDEQWVYEYGAIYGDDNDDDGFDQRSDDDVRRRQHNIDSEWRWYVRLELRSNNGLNNGKCSEHLYGDGNKQWLY